MMRNIIVLNILPADNLLKAHKDDKNLYELFDFNKINIIEKRHPKDILFCIFFSVAEKERNIPVSRIIIFDSYTIYVIIIY